LRAANCTGESLRSIRAARRCRRAVEMAGTEDVLENDRVIVQRFVMNPGQWEGVHAHHPNTLYIFITGGQWLSRTTNPPSQIVGNSPAGDVGWMPAIDLGAGHESGNTGKTPSDVVWIALKR